MKRQIGMTTLLKNTKNNGW